MTSGGASVDPRIICSVDLGKVSDPTAIAILEERPPKMLAEIYEQKTRGLGARLGSAVGLKPAYPRPFKLLGLKRMELGTSYPRIVSYVQHVMSLPHFYGKIELVVDGTGVGVAVVDMFEEAGLEPISITIHGGEQTVVDGRHYRVPKRDLIGALLVAFQEGLIEVPKSSHKGIDWEALKKELLAFKPKISAKGHDSYEAREGANDDCVLALSQAVWRRRPPGGRVLITGTGILAPDYGARIERERLEMEAIGLKHPLDIEVATVTEKLDREAKMIALEKRLHTESNPEKLARELIAQMYRR